MTTRSAPAPAATADHPTSQLFADDNAGGSAGASALARRHLLTELTPDCRNVVRGLPQRFAAGQAVAAGRG